MRIIRHCLLVLPGLAACSGSPAEATRTSGAGASPAALPTTKAAAATPAPAAANSVPWQHLALRQLPAALRPTGQLLEAGRWLDLNGENILVASRSVITDDDQAGEGRAARLLVRQYVRPLGGTGFYRQLWQLQDAVTDCPLDLTLGLLPGSTCVSDLDGNGRTETTLVYALACRGGVDPAALKLILREGAAKYALRGIALEMQGGPDEVARARQQAAGPTCCAGPDSDSTYWRNYGLYDTEKEFATAPPAFLAFARQQWRRWRTRADAGTEVQ